MYLFLEESIIDLSIITKTINIFLIKGQIILASDWPLPQAETGNGTETMKCSASRDTLYPPGPGDCQFTQLL